MPENKVTQNTLNDFLATVKAEPNISDSDILKSFPEFNNDKRKLDAAWSYKNTLDSKKYKSLDEVNSKFPEFFTQPTVTKPVEEKGLWESISEKVYPFTLLGAIGSVSSYFSDRNKPVSNTITSQVDKDYKKSTDPVEYKQPTVDDRKKYSEDIINTFTDIFNQKQISKNFDIHKPTIELQQFKPNQLQSFQQTSDILSKLGFVSKPLEDEQGNILPDSSYQYDPSLPRASKQEIEQIKIDLFNSKQEELKRKQFEATNIKGDGAEITSLFSSYSKNKQIENEIDEKYNKAFALIDEVEGDINNPFKLPNVFDGVSKQDAKNQKLVNQKATNNLQLIKQKREEFVKTFSIPKDSFDTENKKNPLLNELGDLGYDMLYYNNPVLADNKKTALKAGVLNEFDSQKAIGTALTKLIQDNNTDLKYNEDLLKNTRKRVNEETAKINSGKYIYNLEQKQSIAEANKLAGILQQTIKEQEEWSNFLNQVRDKDTPVYKESKVEQERLNQLGNKYPILSTLNDLAGNLWETVKGAPEWFDVAKSNLFDKGSKETLLKSMRYESPGFEDISPMVKSAGAEQLQPLKEASAIQLFNEKGEKEFDYSWRPLLYQSGKMGAEMIPFMVGQFVAQGVKYGIGRAISSQIGKIGAGAAATEIGGYGGLSSIADVTATSIGRDIGSQAVSEAIQKGALQSVGFTAATTLGYAANMIPSTMYFGGEMFKNYVRAGFQPHQAAKLALLASAAEGATESIFTNEMDFVRNLTKKGTIKNASELAENQIYKDAIVNVFKTKFTERQALNLYNYIFKPITKAGLDVLEEGTEEVFSLAFTDFVVDSQARKFKGDYDSGEDFDLENIANTYLSTAATMGLMVGGSVVGGIKNRRAEIKNAQYIVASSPSKYIQTTLNLLEKGHITNDEAQKRINLINKQNQSYQDAFKKGSEVGESKNYTSDEKDQLIFRLFSENYKKQELSDVISNNPNEKDKSEIIELLDSTNNNIFSLLTDGLYKSDKDRSTSRNNYLNSFFTNEAIKEYTSLPTIFSLISQMKEEQKKESDEDLKNTYQSKIDLLEKRKNEVISLKQELAKTPEQKATDNNQAGKIKIQKSASETVELEFNTPYYLSTIEDISATGAKIKQRPIVQIIQDNGNGTVKIVLEGEVTDIPFEDLAKYTFDKQEDIEKLRKDKHPKLIAWDNENNVFTYEWDNAAGNRDKIERGRLQWNEQKQTLQFVYKDKKGVVKYFDIPKTQIEKFRDNNKNAKLVFERSLLKNANQQKEKEKAINTVKDSNIDNLKNQSARRWEFFKNYIAEKNKELQNTKSLISEVEDELLDTEIEMEKLQKQLSEKQKISTKEGKIRADVQKLFNKLNNLQNSIKKLESILNQYQKQKEDLENEIEFVSAYKEKEFEVGSSIVNQLIDDQFNLESQLEQVNTVISNLRNLVSGLESTIKKVASIINNLVLGFEKVYGKERLSSFDYDAIQDIKEISKLFSKEYPDLPTFLEKNPEYFKNLLRFNELVNQNLDKLDLSEKQIDDLNKSIKANIDVAKKIQDKIRYQENLIAEATKSQKEFEEGKVNKKKQEIISKLFVKPTTNLVDPNDSSPKEEYDAKVDLLISGNSTATGGTQNNPLPNQSVIDFQEFLNNVENIRKFRLLAITKDNAKKYGLEDIVFSDDETTNKTDAEDDNDIVLVIVLNNNSETPTFVDKQGNPLTEVNKDNVVYTKMRKASLTFGEKTKKTGEKNYSTTLTEEKETEAAAKILEARKKLRQSTINYTKSGNNAYFQINGVSRGHVNQQSNSPKSVVGTILPENFDLSVNQVVSIPKQADPKEKQGDVQFAGDGTIRKFPKGRTVLNFNHFLAFLNNKKFTQTDVNKFVKIFKYLYDNIENKEETDIILDYLRKTLYFRNPGKVSQTTEKAQESPISPYQIWISREEGMSYLNLGGYKIPFQFEKYDTENLLILETYLNNIPGGLFHNVDIAETKEGNVLMEPFIEITEVDKDGDLVIRKWKTYQEYLLSNKYPNGKERPSEELPLFTKIDNSTPNNPNIVGRYLLFGNEGGEYEKIIKDLKTQTKKATVPTAPSTQGQLVNLVYQKGITRINQIKELGEYILQSTQDNKIKHSIIWDGKKATLVDTTLTGYPIKDVEKSITDQILGKTASNFDYLIWKNEIVQQPVSSVIPKSEVKEEPTEKVNTDQGTVTKTNEDLTEEDIFKFLEENSEEGGTTGIETRLATKTSGYELIDLEKAEAWWKQRFPQIPFRTVTGFINNRAFGALYQGAVIISRAAEVGTEFHEAFEVFWKHFSSPAQMRRNIRDFKNRKGTFVDYDTGQTIEYKNATYKQVKENLAEEFREYELSGGKIKWEGEYEKNSLFRIIRNAIVDFFLNTESIEDVFKAISDGKFKTATPKNLNLNDLNAETRISQLKKNSVFFNDAMKSITFYLFETLNASDSSIPQIFDELGKVKGDLNKEYNKVKEVFEVFYSSNNLPALLSLPKDKFVKVFSNKEYFEKYKGFSNDLRTGINQFILENRLSDVEGAEKLYDVLNSANVLLNNWNEAVELHKNYLSKYGIEFTTDEDVQTDENDKTSEYTPEITKYNKKVNTNSQIKALIATLTAKKKITTFTGGEFPITSTVNIRNSILQPELVDFGATFVQLLYKLAPSSTFEEMTDILLEEAEVNPSLNKLVDRLDLRNNGELSSRIVDLRNKFYQAMNSMIVDYNNLLINSNYTGSAVNVNDVKQKKKIINKWVNNLKGSNFVVYGEDGSMMFSSTNFTKPENLDTSITFLNQIGFNTTFKKSELTPKEIISVLASSAKIYEVIKSTNASQIFWQDAAILSKPIDELSEIEQKYSNDYFESQHINIEGEPVSNILLNNFLGYVTKAFNYSNTLNDFFKSIPQLNPENSNNAFQKNSLILSKNSKFYDKEGKRKNNISISILEGLKDRETDNYTHSSEMSKSDMFAHEFAYNLDGQYSILTPADSRTPWGWNIGTFVSKEEALDNKQYLKIFKQYLVAEIEAGRQENVYNLAELDKRKNSLSFFNGVISLDIDNDTPAEQLISENEEMINSQFEALLEGKVDQTVNYLFQEGLIKDFKSEGKVTVITSNTIPPKMIMYVGSQHQSTGLSNEQIRNLVRFREINYMINIIEQHKVLWGNPNQWKAATKRIKSFMSGRRLSINNADYFDKHNNKFSNQRTFINENGEPEIIQLSSEDTNFHRFSDVMKVQTVKDVFSIPVDNVLKDIQDALKSVEGAEVDKFEETNQADAQSWAFLPGYREIRKRDNTWNDAEEEMFLFDEANMFQDLLKEGRDLYPTGEKGKKLKKAHEQIIKRGNPYINRLKSNDTLPVLNVLKPIYSGFKNVFAAILNVDKTSMAPLTWSLVKDYPGMRDLYIAHYLKGTHFLKVESSNKIGKRNDIQSLYNNDGSVNTNVQQEELNFKYFGIQVETIGQKDKSTLGTQMTKLISVGLMKFGVPNDVNLTRKEWNSLSEEEKEEKSELYKLVKRNHTILSNMKEMAKKQIFNDFGISEVIENGKKFYKFSNLLKLNELIQREFKERDVAENIKELVKVVVENGKEKFVAPLDAIIGAEKLEAIFTSIIDKNILRPKLRGGQLPQISSVLFEKNKRKAVYKKGNSWVPVKNYDTLTEKEKNSIRLTADNLKFYKNEDGKRVCEVILPYIFKSMLKDGEMLSIDNIPEELLYGIGFRIPTQGHNSIEHFKIKGFLPIEYGDAVIVPAEITTKAGSDFDIDKLNIYLYNYYINLKTGIPQKIKYLDNSNSTAADRYENYKTRNSKVKEIYGKYAERINKINDSIQRSWQIQTTQLNKLISDKQLSEKEIEDLFYARREKEIELAFEKADVKEANLLLKELEKGYEEDPESTQLMARIAGYEGDMFSILNQANQELEEKQDNVLKIEDEIESIQNKIKTISADKIKKADVQEKVNKRIKRQEEYISEKQKILKERTDEINNVVPDISFEEFEQLPIEQQNSKKALENVYIDNIREILQRPEIFPLLITPNTAKPLEEIAETVRELYGEKEKTSLPISSYLDSLSNVSTRYAYLVGKKGVGIAAKNNTSHAICMELGVDFNPVDLLNLPSLKYLGISSFNISMPYNQENGLVVMSSDKDAEGKYRISDVIGNMFLNAFVDIANNPFISDINGNITTAGVYLTAVRMGIPISYIGRFMSQPVIKDYIKLVQSNKSISTIVSNTKLKKAEIISVLQSKYGFGNIQNERENNYTLEELENFIKNQKSPEFSQEQGYILGQYLVLEQISNQLLAFDQAFPDTTRTVSFESIRLKLYNIDKAKKTIFGKYVPSLLNRTFLGSTIKGKFQILKALRGTNDSEAIYLTEKSTIREFLKPIIHDIYSHFIPNDEKERLSKDMKRQLISYLIQTIPISLNGEIESPLTSQIERLLLNPEQKNTIGSRLRNLQFSLQEKKIDVPNNMFVPNLLSVFPALSKGLVTTINLLRKPTDKIDSDGLTNDFSTLFEYGKTRPLAYDLVKTALLKTGVTYTPNSFTEIIPAEIFEKIVSQVDKKLNDPIFTQNLLSNFQNSFAQNRYYDNSLVYFTKAQNSSGKSRIKRNIIVLKDKSTGENYSVPVIQYNTIKDLGEEVYLNRDLNHKYLMTIDEVYKEPPAYEGDLGTRYSPREKENMKKQGDYSFRKINLWMRVDAQNPNTGKVEPVLGETFNEKYGTTWNYVMYIPIPLMGDRSNLMEHYSKLRTSQVNEFFPFTAGLPYSVQENKRINEVYLSIINNSQNFHEWLQSKLPNFSSSKFLYSELERIKGIKQSEENKGIDEDYFDDLEEIATFETMDFLDRVESEELEGFIGTTQPTTPVVTPTQSSTSVKPKIDSSKKINIYASTGENAELSNFAERPVRLGNETFRTPEGGFQAMKIWFTNSVLLGNPASEKNIKIFEKLKTASGAEAKKLGQQIEDLSQGTWDRDSSGVMKNILTLSFEQNPDALAKLLATGNATLTHTQDKGKWGTEFPKLLMEVREELKSQQPSTQPTERKTYSGKVTSLQPNQIFVFGSNPEGRHGAGAAKDAKDLFGAKYGQGRGMQGQSYALVTKNLKAGFIEPSTSIKYEKAGEKSVSPAQITTNIKELYAVATQNPTKEFLIPDYSKSNLNGYSGQEMADMFVNAGTIPSNIVFNENFDKLIPTQPTTKPISEDFQTIPVEKETEYLAKYGYKILAMEELGEQIRFKTGTKESKLETFASDIFSDFRNIRSYDAKDLEEFFSKSDSKKLLDLKPLAKEFEQRELKNSSQEGRTIENVKKVAQLNQQILNTIVDIFNPVIKTANIKFELYPLTTKPTEDFNTLLEFTEEEKQIIISTFASKHGLSEQEALLDINKGLNEDKQGTIDKLNECF